MCWNHRRADKFNQIKGVHCVLRRNPYQYHCRFCWSQRVNSTIADVLTLSPCVPAWRTVPLTATWIYNLSSFSGLWVSALIYWF
ncbi:hypothetical protein BDR07DRAFT_637357 [Suillus spraguei]|nr:hypothetical protein BDR07DRAFT_637357 [Suillus spraguei]